MQSKSSAGTDFFVGIINWVPLTWVEIVPEQLFTRQLEVKLRVNLLQLKVKVKESEIDIVALHPRNIATFINVPGGETDL